MFCWVFLQYGLHSGNGYHARHPLTDISIAKHMVPISIVLTHNVIIIYAYWTKTLNSQQLIFCSNTDCHWYHTIIYKLHQQCCFLNILLQDSCYSDEFVTKIRFWCIYNNIYIPRFFQCSTYEFYLLLTWSVQICSKSVVGQRARNLSFSIGERMY